MKTAVLVSGRGSNFRALVKAKEDGKLPHVDFACMVSNNPKSPALEFAREHGIPTEVVPHREYGSREEHEQAIIERLDAHGVEFLVLAGYMRLLTGKLVGTYAGRIINIHPALLPSFPGTHGQRQAFDYGVRWAGLTVHFVDETTDGGPIILQRIVPVLQTDTEDSLADRILTEEHKALPLALDLASRGRLLIEGRRVVIRTGECSFPELEPDLHAIEPILVATGNNHKLDEIGKILSDIPLRLLGTRSFPAEMEPVEDGSTYEDNARIKAVFWGKHHGVWALADDSGLEVDALNGRPGLHSSRYAPTQEQRNALLLSELADVPDEKRTARFVCTVVLRSPGGEVHVARGTCEGRIAHEPRGDGGFGYDPIFVPDGFAGSHLAELGEDVKNRISHRARALEDLKPVLRRLFAP